jgi:hypothetical protein
LNYSISLEQFSFLKPSNLVNIVIPVYKEEISNFEQISLKQCVKLLSRYQITIICSKHLDIKTYLQIYSKFNIEYFEDNFFSSIDGYNRLMLSPAFYRRFINYKYILIYQLDAYVFKDELMEWCLKRLDYIGAPWFENWHESTLGNNTIGVGNGGFSLRCTRSFLDQFKMIKRVLLIEKYSNRSVTTKLKGLGSIIKDLLFYREIDISNLNLKEQEDFFWCIGIHNYYQKYDHSGSFLKKFFIFSPVKRLKIADISTAMKFSFECQPSRLFELNSRTLPFGCHAWHRYEYSFWKQFIISTELNIDNNQSELVRHN